MSEQVNLVKMIREEPQRSGGPLTADVHPDEVVNYQRGGWQIAASMQTITPQPVEAPAIKPARAAKK